MSQGLLVGSQDGLLGGEEFEALVLLLVAEQHEQDGDVCDVLPAQGKLQYYCSARRPLIIIHLKD